MYRKYLFTLIFIVTPLQATAEVERSVDKQGNVTFSDKPVAGSVSSESVSIDAPAPSSDRVNKSQRESQAIIDKAKRSQQQPVSTGQSGVSKKQSVENARKQLDQAKVIGDNDRRGKAGGGSRLTPEYLDRVKAAEKNLEQAEKAGR